MKVGIISYYSFEKYIVINKKSVIYENWNKAWLEVFKLSKKNNIELLKYDSRFHNEYEKLMFIEIPRINELLKVLFSNIFKKRIFSILIINETFLGRARYMLRIPFLFNKVLINCEDSLNKFMSYKTSTFSYPSLPSKNKINLKKSLILNSNRKNKLVFISSFKIALSKHGTYKFRYKLVKELLNYKRFFKLYGHGWDRVPLPFDIVGIAIILRISILKKLLKRVMQFFYKPLGSFPMAKSKEKTLYDYDFTLAIEPTKGKFNSICEKIFDPMISGSIPVYYGQKLSPLIPKNTYLEINDLTSAEDIINKIQSLTKEKKEEYRKNIFNFLKSKKADKYRHRYYAKTIIKAILN